MRKIEKGFINLISNQGSTTGDPSLFAQPYHAQDWVILFLVLKLLKRMISSYYNVYNVIDFGRVQFGIIGKRFRGNRNLGYG